MSLPNLVICKLSSAEFMKLNTSRIKEKYNSVASAAANYCKQNVVPTLKGLAKKISPYVQDIGLSVEKNIPALHSAGKSALGIVKRHPVISSSALIAVSVVSCGVLSGSGDIQIKLTDGTFSVKSENISCGDIMSPGEEISWKYCQAYGVKKFFSGKKEDLGGSTMCFARTNGSMKNKNELDTGEWMHSADWICEAVRRSGAW